MRAAARLAFCCGASMHTYSTRWRCMTVVVFWGWGMDSTWAQLAGSWHPDADGDGEVWTQDLLDLLAAFGGG